LGRELDRPPQDHEDLVTVDRVGLGRGVTGLEREPPRAEVARSSAGRGEPGELQAGKLEARCVSRAHRDDGHIDKVTCPSLLVYRIPPMAEPDLGILLALAFQQFVAELREHLGEQGFDDLARSDGYVFRALDAAPLTTSALADRLGVTKQGAG